MNLIRDILNSHKMFIFGSFNCTEYKLKEFHDDIMKAEREIFGDAICTPHITVKSGGGRAQISDDLIKSNATLYPSWLVADDLFEVFQYHFAVSQWLNTLKTEDIGKRLNVFCCVIPEKWCRSMISVQCTLNPLLVDRLDMLWGIEERPCSVLYETDG